MEDEANKARITKAERENNKRIKGCKERRRVNL